ncbi:MAG: tyrosine-type recombinase/integrase [Candidatus Ancillula trichonymphae]|jgi:integrase/recombinase XerC|nr:tyrosine-type recombinase/integrase [Candidatus Ancillula trichonymphae]
MKSADAVLIFVKNLQIRDYSVDTCRSYVRVLEVFCAFLEEIGVQEVEVVDLEILRAYVAKLVGSKVKRVTIRHKISVLKAFFTFLFQNDYISKNPTARIKYPKIGKTLPHILSIEQISKILDFASRSAEYERCNNLKSYPSTLQNYALVELLYSSGLRISETLGLTAGDLYFEQNQLCVTGKGNKSRVVPFNNAARRVLLELVEQRCGSNWLFVSDKGTRLQPRGAYRAIVKLAKSAGVDGVHPHSFRHTMATHMIDNSADIRIVQEILGHASITTTQKYIHVSSKKIQTIYSQAFWRA